MVTTIERGCVLLKGEKYGSSLRENHTLLPSPIHYLCLCDLYLKTEKEKTPEGNLIYIFLL